VPDDFAVRANVALVSEVWALDAARALNALERTSARVTACEKNVVAAHRLVESVVTAKLDAKRSQRALDAAYEAFAELRDDFGLAQCALAQIRIEMHGKKRLHLVERLFRYAAEKYRAMGYHAWASRTILWGLVPLLMDDMKADEKIIMAAFGDAARCALHGECFHELELITRLASRTGFSANIGDFGRYGTFEIRKTR
jgi:hypothetical protein